MFPLLWLSLAFMGGLIIDHYLPLPWWAWLGMTVICIALAVLEWKAFPRSKIELNWRRLAPLPLGVILAVTGMGGLRGVLQRFTSGSQLVSLSGQQVVLTGFISSDPTRTSSSQYFDFSVESIQTEDASAASSIKGKVYIQARGDPEYFYGNKLVVKGYLREVDDSSGDFETYLAQQGMQGRLLYPQVEVTGQVAGNWLLRMAYGLRAKAYEAIQAIFTRTEGALFSGVLLGIDNDLPESLTQAYQATGTAHIYAISGFNIAIVAGMVTNLFRKWFTKWYAALLAVLSIIFYSLMVGGSPSVVRAAIMGSLGIAAGLVGRRSGMTSLVFAAAVMCLITPGLPWNISFQLSFGATLGIMLFAGPLRGRLESWLEKRVPAAKARKWVDPISEYFLSTLSAQALTLPILAYHFQRLSVTSIIVNPLILPVQPLLMILGGLAVIAGLVWVPLGRVLGWLAWPFAAYTNRMVEWLGSWGGNLQLGAINAWTVLGFYLILFILLFTARRWRRTALLGAAGIGLLLAVLLVWQAVLTHPDGNLHVTLYPAEDGTWAFVQTPHGKNILIIEGSGGGEALTDIDRRISIFQRRLDSVLVASGSSATLNALDDLLAEMPIEQVYWLVEPGDSSAADYLLEDLAEQKTGQVFVNESDVIILDENVQIVLLVKTKDTCSLRIDQGNFHLLLPAELTPSGLAGYKPPPTLIVLMDDDLDAALPAEWNAIGAVIVWGEGIVDTPDEKWVSLYQRDWLRISTDGVGMWMRGK